ncbi:hypothetical protein DFJ74DRAFT_112180 [Hyaloraphidium curvatum]|nr:hypothetical protein DFJ74DRAFT_112180 [Hyaloraphidium curvatum]
MSPRRRAVPGRPLLFAILFALLAVLRTAAANNDGGGATATTYSAVSETCCPGCSYSNSINCCCAPNNFATSTTTRSLIVTITRRTTITRTTTTTTVSPVPLRRLLDRAAGLFRLRPSIVRAPDAEDGPTPTTAEPTTDVHVHDQHGLHRRHTCDACPTLTPEPRALEARNNGGNSGTITKFCCQTGTVLTSTITLGLTTVTVPTTTTLTVTPTPQPRINLDIESNQENTGRWWSLSVGRLVASRIGKRRGKEADTESD